MPTLANPFRRLFAKTPFSQPRARGRHARPQAAMVSQVHRTEQLDDRVMLNGNVTVEVLAGGTTLKVTGDGEANEIIMDFIVEAGNSRIFFDNFDADTTINGSGNELNIPAAGITTININMGDGDDVVDSLAASIGGAAWSNPNAFGALDILLVDMGDGNDRFDLDGRNIAGVAVPDNVFTGIATVQGGPGNDTMTLENWGFGGDVRFRGISGNDQMFLTDVSIGGTLRARTNFGEDRLTINRVEVDGETRIAAGSGGPILTEITNLKSQGTVTVRGADDMDYVSIVDSVSGNDLVVSTFEGDDLVRLQRVAVTGQTQIVTAEGDDHVFLNGDSNNLGAPGYLIFGDRLFITTGADDDNIMIISDPGRTFFGENAVIRGETGTDLYQLAGTINTPFGTTIEQNLTADDGTLGDPILDALVASFGTNFGFGLNADAFRPEVSMN